VLTRCFRAVAVADWRRAITLVYMGLAEALDEDLADALAPLLTAFEIEATRRRVARLLRVGALPIPRGDWPAIPWPPF
jgi:hypothetical protein